ncbi:MAG: hypothetical protein AAF298_12540 [Cyanobacteria bacterium P01_A01_bin.40]
MKSKLNQSIKIISTIIITGSLGLECWNFYLYSQGKSLPDNLNSLFWVGSIILIAHLIEALIAATKASSYQRNPLSYGLYTFFVGFVGLQELLND